MCVQNSTEFSHGGWLFYIQTSSCNNLLLEGKSYCRQIAIKTMLYGNEYVKLGFSV